MEYRYQDICGKNLHRLNISIGGDNYCYDNMLDRLISANRMFHKQGAKTVLYGLLHRTGVVKTSGNPGGYEALRRHWSRGKA